MSEMRTMASSSATATKPGAGGKGGEDGADAAPKKGKMKLIVIVVLALVVVGGAAYWFLLKPSGHKAAATTKAPPPVAGVVFPIDPISVNLADGHYLKIGIALQEKKGAEAITDGSQALDSTISIYSNQTMAALSTPASRDAVKAQLVKAISKDYDGNVYDVYFTSYVMQ